MVLRFRGYDRKLLGLIIVKTTSKIYAKLGSVLLRNCHETAIFLMSLHFYVNSFIKLFFTMEFANSTTEKQGLPAVQGGRRRVASRISAEMQLNSIFDDVNVIGGGQENTISAGAQHSFIGGGINNVVNANCGAILGGENNTVNHAYAGVFGNGVTSVMANAFHAEELVLGNIPVDPVPGGGAVFASLPNGAFYTTAAPGGPFLSRPVDIK